MRLPRSGALPSRESCSRSTLMPSGGEACDVSSARARQDRPQVSIRSNDCRDKFIWPGGRCFCICGAGLYLLVGIGTVPAVPVDIGFPAQGEEGVEGPDCRTGQTAEKSAEDVHSSAFCAPQSRRSLPTKRKRGTEIPLTETGSGKPSGLNRTQSHATERDVEITMPIFSLNKIYQILFPEDRTHTFV